MDKGNEQRENRWGWLPTQMPGVARLIAEKRAKWGNDHVNECWRRGVLNMEPDWFFAREGALAVGAPWTAPEFANFGALSVTRTQALLLMREPANGAS